MKLAEGDNSVRDDTMLRNVSRDFAAMHRRSGKHSQTECNRACP